MTSSRDVGQAPRRASLVAAPCLLFVGVVACTPAPAVVEHAPRPEQLWSEARPEACRFALNRPYNHRLLRVTPSTGEVVALEGCDRAHCVDGTPSIVITRDAREATKQHVGFHTGRTLVVENGDPRLRGTFRGVLAGNDTVFTVESAVENGVENNIENRSLVATRGEGAPRVMPFPPLVDREIVVRGRVSGDVTYVHVIEPRGNPARREGARTRWLAHRADSGWQPSDRPVFDDDRVCGTLRADASGFVFEGLDGRVLPLVTTPERDLHLDARCVGDSVLFSSWRKRRVERVDLGAWTTTAAALPRGHRVFFVDDAVYTFHPTEGVYVVDGVTPTLHFAFAPGRDVTGALPPQGAWLERMDFTNAKEKLLVLTRYRTETCELVDRVAIVDVAAKSARTVRDGLGFRVMPVAAKGDLYVVEADAETSSVE